MNVNDSIYLTLSSNVDKNFFPDNTLTHFQNKLAQPLDFNSADFEVGLAEIQLPFNWKTFHSDDIWIHLFNTKNGKQTKVALSEGYYKTNYMFLQGLNKLTHLLSKDDGFKDSIHFIYKPRRHKVVLEIKSKYIIIKISPKLRRILGFEDETLSGYKQPHISKEIIDLTDGFTHLYIYTNLAEYRSVGHDMLPLLRVIPVKKTEKDAIISLVTFETVHYSMVTRRLYDTIEIDIRTDTGESVKFERGHILVTLHLRQKK